MNKVITIKDIAREAGASIATVSRALNGKEGVSEETKNHVLEIADNLGYRSNALARGLKLNRTNTIGVLFPEMSSQISNLILKGIEAIATEKNTSIIVGYTFTDDEKTYDVIETMIQNRVDGLIFSNQQFTKRYRDAIENRSNIPYVLCATRSLGKNDKSAFMIDDLLAAREGTNYLIKQGHTNITLVAGTIDQEFIALQRVNGYKEAMEEAGLNTNIIDAQGYDFNSGKKVFDKLLNSTTDFSALFCTSDELAIGVMHRAIEHGYRIPEDFSVLGFDNIPLSQMFYPPLTTISQNFYDIGYQSAQALFNLIDGKENIEEELINTPFQLMERLSVKRLK